VKIAAKMVGTKILKIASYINRLQKEFFSLDSIFNLVYDAVDQIVFDLISLNYIDLNETNNT